MYYCAQGTWVWTDGTTLDYTSWYYPALGGTAENCMLMYSDAVDWNDVSCTFTASNLNYVCKL
jgi:hypothetical protein